ncbi:MAG TPA: polysaccharide biosynthesis C-terminal domain-containing protein [Saprospiraceae bacterium]|mgnify:CR=1 FL=1|nr:polysaccharide biosynthesis C-terminal domain-containing protein [Saprospiraceae bacterium]HMQ82791.1 polysaccharide biosynthesis C-terminal domain-containing protein [Saprospiraceae bacterium]
MSLLKKLAGETAIYGTSSILSRLLNYVILTPYFTRVFQPDEYGVVSDLYTWAALLMVLFTWRLETAFFRYGSEEGMLGKSFGTATAALFGITAMLTFVLVVFAQPLANVLRYPQHPEYVVWFAFIMAFDALAAIPFGRLRLENKPVRFAIFKTLNILINIVFVFFFLELCPLLAQAGYAGFENFYRPEDSILYVFVSNCIASLLIFFLLLPAYFRLRQAVDMALLKRMLVYAGPLVIVGIAGVINQLIGIPMIKELASDDMEYNKNMMGIFSAASKIAVLMSLFTQAFNYAAEPFFFRNAARTDKKQLYAQVALAFTIAGSLVFLGVLLYLDIIQYFIGKDFRAGLGVVPLLLLAYLFLGLYYNFSIWYKLADRTAIGGYIATIGAIITLALNYYLIPRWGYYGPGWAALACYFFMAMASYLTGRKYYPIDYPVGKMSVYILSCLIIYFLSLWLRPWLIGNMWLLFAVNSMLLLCFFLLVFWMERDKLARFLPGKKAN